jgi:pSer/pThr/pTyr-binding forkhead associated (FHA) protein
MFCDECGERLDAQASGTPVAVASAPASAAPTPTAPAAAPTLTVESDNATFDLAGKSEWMIGREDPVSSIFPDIDLTPHGGEEGGVSRLHAKLYIQGNQYLIEDQNSTNFTFVNRQKLAPKTPTPIKDGDEIKLGRVAMRFKTT